jgi:hypothetical protein
VESAAVESWDNSEIDGTREAFSTYEAGQACELLRRSRSSEMSDAIPTQHNGVQYRSRLEAQWAAVLDAHGIRHEYERITCFFGRVAPRHWMYIDVYRPDLWLPDLKLWVEIKPSPPNIIEFRKAALLAECTGTNVLITTGSPTIIETALLVRGINDYEVVSTLDGSAPIKLDVDRLTVSVGNFQHISSALTAVIDATCDAYAADNWPGQQARAPRPRPKRKLVLFMLPNDDHTARCFCKAKARYCSTCARYIRSYVTDESAGRLKAARTPRPPVRATPAWTTTRARYLLGGYRPAPWRHPIKSFQMSMAKTSLARSSLARSSASATDASGRDAGLSPPTKVERRR